MAVCLPCGHAVDEKSAPQWTYKGTTFYFCDPECGKTVKAEPEKWLAVAKTPPAGHGHGHEH